MVIGRKLPSVRLHPNPDRRNEGVPMGLPAELRDLAQRVSNWGRWGADDQRGTLNLITPEAVHRGARAIRSGRVFSLAIPFDDSGPQWDNVNMPDRNAPSPLYCLPSTPTLTSGSRVFRVNCNAASACLICDARTSSFGSFFSAVARSFSLSGIAGATEGNSSVGHPEPE
jgi:hypothetical protein